MVGFERPWWFAGGQAIDAFLGYQSRVHGDIDIACLRKDQIAIQRQLAGLDTWCADPPGSLRPWPEGELLPDSVHDIWCRESPHGPWRLQLMLDESDGDHWVFRRAPAIRRRFDELLVYRDGVPYLAVEVQLLYKAGRPGAPMPAKNQQDFDACLPHLDAVQRAWLASALQAAHPGHTWIGPLESSETPRNT
jgi:hypothetical protein